MFERKRMDEENITKMHYGCFQRRPERSEEVVNDFFCRMVKITSVKIDKSSKNVVHFKRRTRARFSILRKNDRNAAIWTER